MRCVAIYDPGRVPMNWMDLLHTGQFAVFIQRRKTSVVLDSTGVPVAEGTPKSCLPFDSLAEAKQFCHELAERAQTADAEWSALYGPQYSALLV